LGRRDLATVTSLVNSLRSSSVQPRKAARPTNEEQSLLAMYKTASPAQLHAMTTIHPSTLAIEGVSHRYGARQALIDVTFSVAPSTFTVLLGLNGAGKSTLFSLTTRLYAIQQGRIRIFGHDVARASKRASRCCGPLTSSTKSCRRIISLSCIKDGFSRTVQPHISSRQRMLEISAQPSFG
jgi:ABC-type multidrug transport system fused ATPase/permease subunit